VLTSPIGRSTPVATVAPKDSRGESDYMVASPILQKPQCTGDAEEKKTSVSLAGAAASDVKLSSIVPKSTDSAYYSLDISKKAVGGHEGTSVDPPSPQPSTAKYPSPQCSQEICRPKESESSEGRLSDKPKQPLETARSPLGNRKEKKDGRTKHKSGSSCSGSPAMVKSGSKGILQTGGLNSGEGVQLLEEPGSTALPRPGSTPCMLTLDEPTSQPVTMGTTLKVDSNPRGRHSISDLSAYEQMTFSSNTLSSSAGQSSSSTLSTSQQQIASSGSQKVLNYATLDLGSAEAVGEGDCLHSPRSKSRHTSAEDKGALPIPYAQIDFEKSENLKSTSGNKDVKFTL